MRKLKLFPVIGVMYTALATISVVSCSNQEKEIDKVREKYDKFNEEYNKKIASYATKIKEFRKDINGKDEAKKTQAKADLDKYLKNIAPEVKTLKEEYNKLFKELSKAEEKSHIKTFKIYHTNDEHGRIEYDGGKYSNYSGMVGLSKYLQGRDYDLLLSAGDLIQGLPLSDSDKGKTITKLAKEMNYAAVAVGNHEFDFGLQHIIDLNNEINPDKDKPQMPFLSSNIRWKETKDGHNKGDRVFKPYIIKEIKGVKIAIFGITTPDTAFTSHPKNSVDVIFGDPVEEARKVLAEIEQENVNFTIAITHLGVNREQNKEWESNWLLKKVPNIDLLLDGHSHTKVELHQEGIDSHTYQTQTEAYTKYLGDINLRFDTKTGKIVNISSTLRDINEITSSILGIELKKSESKLINDLKAEYGEKNSVVVFKNTVEFIHGRNETVDGVNGTVGRLRQTNLGVFVADAIAYEVYEAKPNPNDSLTLDNVVGLVNAGDLRIDVPTGDITRETMIAMNPFGGRVSAVKVKGDVLRKTIKFGAESFSKGGFGQWSSNVEFDIKKEMVDGKEKRVAQDASIKINGKEIVDNQEYIIVANDYLVAAGDNYTMLKTTPYYENKSMLETIIAYGNYVNKDENFKDDGKDKKDNPFAHKLSYYGEASTIQKIKHIA
ncbi:bifunctional metallophosphatase/5'-nucleotidase [Mycoplasmopsis opalescens]|uniref:bifunctional metallophosphatase/5'-nucleotidase n=1 Tax=Mycoplasmopsis opalescens TaxID=114886 RepID=UPI00068EF58C|nr:bifunctional UDP-sugar hydrolase/5'-nucleotidase [Mycoplasmopsis opalescens]